MDNFYITLPSNVVSDKFNNTVANYTTKLAAPVNLEGDWELGLSSISYTKSWYNLSKSEYIKLWYFDTRPQYHYIKVDSLTGQYEDIDLLMDTLNKLMREAMYIISLSSKTETNTENLAVPEPLPSPQALSAKRKFVIEEMKRIQQLYNDNMEAKRKENEKKIRYRTKKKITSVNYYASRISN